MPQVLTVTTRQQGLIQPLDSAAIGGCSDLACWVDIEWQHLGLTVGVVARQFTAIKLKDEATEGNGLDDSATEGNGLDDSATDFDTTEALVLVAVATRQCEANESNESSVGNNTLDGGKGKGNTKAPRALPRSQSRFALAIVDAVFERMELWQ